jgi:hypothetical protein
MPRQRKFKIADPAEADHEADVDFALSSYNLAGARDVLLSTAELAERWRVKPGAIRKMRDRGTGPPFIVMNRKRILYRLLDVINYEANRLAFTRPQAKTIGLL